MEERLLNIIQTNLNKILDYDPFRSYNGINSTDEFIGLIGQDPAFAPFSLDSKQYTTARFGGNLVTSIHRKLGDIYEDLLLELMIEKYKQSKGYLKYSMELDMNGTLQTRTTDGRLLLKDFDEPLKSEVKKCMTIENYDGLAMEVRSCYQIGDSKRIQADRDMGLALREIKIEPVLVIFCTTSLKSPVKRLKQYWTVYEGKDSFDYVEKMTDFKLFEFLMDNKSVFKQTIDKSFDIVY